jgi:hypothetical protein
MTTLLTNFSANLDGQTLVARSSTAANSTYPKGGVSFSKDSFVVAKNSVLRMKFSGKNPALRVAANRWQQA